MASSGEKKLCYSIGYEQPVCGSMTATHNETPALLSMDAREGTVSGPGGTVRLEPKVMAVLTVLARYSGHVVSREELLDAVWPDAVVTENTVSRCIYQLREQLGRIAQQNAGGSAGLIETLPKRGYRLTVNIEQLPSELRITGDTLLIRLRRPTVLGFGIVLFVLFVLAYLAFFA